MEHLSLDARQGEDRQVNRRDDQYAEQAGLHHLRRRAGCDLEALVPRQDPPESMLRLAEATQAVLDDDHRPVNDQAEVERSQAHEVGRDPILHHAGNGHQHGERDDRRGDQCGAQVAEQRKQHHDHQQRAFDQVRADRGDGAIDECGAVVDRRRDHSLRKARIDLLQSGRGATRNRAAVLADQHEHRAKHDLAAVLGRRAGAQLASLHDLCHLAQPDRHAVAMGDHDVAKLLGCTDLARHANQVLFATAFDVARPDVGVAACNGLHQVAQPDAVRGQSRGIRRDMDLSNVAADGVDLGDTLQVTQLRAHHPVLQRAQTSRRPGLPIRADRARQGFHRVHEDLAEAGGHRSEDWLALGRQLALGLLQAFRDLLPGEVDVGPVLEDDRHLGKPVARDRACVVESGQSGQRGLDRESQSLLGFQRRVARRLGVDLHLDVGDVGRRVDRQARVVPDAESGECQSEHQHQPALCDGESNDSFEHCGGAFSGRGWRRTSRCPP